MLSEVTYLHLQESWFGSARSGNEWWRDESVGRRTGESTLANFRDSRKVLEGLRSAQSSPVEGKSERRDAGGACRALYVRCTGQEARAERVPLCILVHTGRAWETGGAVAVGSRRAMGGSVGICS